MRADSCPPLASLADSGTSNFPISLQFPLFTQSTHGFLGQFSALLSLPQGTTFAGRTTQHMHQTIQARGGTTFLRGITQYVHQTIQACGSNTSSDNARQETQGKFRAAMQVQYEGINLAHNGNAQGYKLSVQWGDASPPLNGHKIKYVIAQDVSTKLTSKLSGSLGGRQKVGVTGVGGRSRPQVTRMGPDMMKAEG